MYLRLLYHESSWRASVCSGAGACGLAQFMPSTAKMYGIDRFNPKQSIDAGADYFARLYRRFGSYELAASAYNIGEGTIDKIGKVHPATKSYVNYIVYGRK